MNKNDNKGHLLEQKVYHIPPHDLVNNYLTTKPFSSQFSGRYGATCFEILDERYIYELPIIGCVC